MRFRVLIAGLLCAVAASAVFATDFAVIIHPDNPVRALSLAEFGKILKGKSVSWPNGRAITIVLRDTDSPSMNFVIEKIMGLPAAEARKALADPSRKGAAAVVFLPTDADVVKAVAGNATAIGIVDVYNITSGVKVIKIDEKQPFDPGYALKVH